MDKLSRFNQWLISIIGVGFIIFCLVGGVVIFSDIFRGCGSSSNRQGGAIVSTEQAQQFVVDSVRKQVVSLNKLFLLDSTKQEFLMPVGQAKLENDE